MKEGRKAQLILLVILACTFLPTLATVPFAQQDSTIVIREVFVKTSIAYLWLSPIMHIITLILLVSLYRYGSKISRIASAFFGFLFCSWHLAITSP